MEIVDDILHLADQWDAEAAEMENRFKYPGGNYGGKIEAMAHFTALRRAAADVRRVLVHRGFVGSAENTQTDF